MKKIAGVIGTGIKEVLEEGGEAAAKGALRGAGRSVKEFGKATLDDMMKSWFRGELKGAVKAIPSNIAKMFDGAKNRNLLNFFRAAPDDKILKYVIGEDGVLKIDNSLRKSIMESVPKEEAAILEKVIQEKCGGSSRVFIRDFAKLKADKSIGKEVISDVVVDRFEKGAVKIEPLSIFSDAGTKKLVTTVDDNLSNLFKADTELAQRMASRPMQQVLGRFAVKTALVGVGVSSAYGGLISLVNWLTKETTNVNQAINNIISEMNDVISEGLTTKAQNATLIVNIRKAGVELRKLNQSLLEASTFNNREAPSKEEAELLKEIQLVGGEVEKRTPTVKQLVDKIEFVLNNVEVYMQDYNKHILEYITSVGIGATADRSKQVIESINKAKPLLDELVMSFDEVNTKVDQFESSVAKKAAPANSTPETMPELPATANNRLKFIIPKSVNRLISIAQEMEKKNENLETPPATDGSKDLFSELATKELKPDDPGFIEKNILQPVGKVVAPAIPKWLITSPTLFNALFSVVDALFLKGNLVLFGGKAGSMAVSKVLSGGAAGIAGGAAGVALSGIFGLDIGHSIGKFLSSAGNTLGEEISDLIGYLEQADGPVKDSEWSKLNRGIQTKLVGSAYIIEKGMNELKANMLTGETLTEEDKPKFEKTMFGMSKVFDGITNIEQALNVLKQTQTRDLYIKHGEGVLGAIARGGDKAVNFVTTFGGLLGNRNVGENTTGFLNIYNAMMDYVEEIEGKLMKIKESLMPFQQNLEKIHAAMKEAKPLIS